VVVGVCRREARQSRKCKMRMSGGSVRVRAQLPRLATLKMARLGQRTLLLMSRQMKVVQGYHARWWGGGWGVVGWQARCGVAW